MRVQGCVAVYPAGRPDGVEVRGSDLARLDDDEFLNDTVIDLYIRCADSTNRILSADRTAQVPGCDA